jgi:hypothetical protein
MTLSILQSGMGFQPMFIGKMPMPRLIFTVRRHFSKKFFWWIESPLLDAKFGSPSPGGAADPPPHGLNLCLVACESETPVVY